MVSGYIQVAADGVGKKVDNAAITLPDGTVQYRQATTVADPSFASNVAGVTGAGDQQTRSFVAEDFFAQLLIELRVMNALLHSTLNCRDDLDNLRAQEALTTFNQTN